MSYPQQAVQAVAFGVVAGFLFLILKKVVFVRQLHCLPNLLSVKLENENV